MNLRTRFERFCYKNRDKGISNLMLYIAIGNAIVCLLGLVNNADILYAILCFDKDKILQGQVWRLFTYVFTQRTGGMLDLIFIYFFYLLGRHVEISMGTFKFNLYYLSGVVLMDTFAMIFCPTIPTSPATAAELYSLYNILSVYANMALYLHLSLLLLFATTHPDSHFLIMFIIPIKGWVIGLIYLLLEVITIVNLSYPVLYFPHNLFPLVALANYLLFAGSDIRNLFPFLRRRPKARKTVQKTGTIQFHTDRPAPQKADFNHRCTICGRTDITDPDLEFRYCSRCSGYHCYCEDHINNHTHIQ